MEAIANPAANPNFQPLIEYLNSVSQALGSSDPYISNLDKTVAKNAVIDISAPYVLPNFDEKGGRSIATIFGLPDLPQSTLEKSYFALLARDLAYFHRRGFSQCLSDKGENLEVKPYKSKTGLIHPETNFRIGLSYSITGGEDGIRVEFLFNSAFMPFFIGDQGECIPMSRTESAYLMNVILNDYVQRIQGFLDNVSKKPNAKLSDYYGVPAKSNNAPPPSTNSDNSMAN